MLFNFYMVSGMCFLGTMTCGYIWPYTLFPCDVGMVLTEDLMPLLSPELYQQFGLPFLERLSREFGSLQVHCCGDWGRHVPAIVESGIHLRAAEFHYPFTTIEELAPLADATVFIPYIALDKQSDFASTTEYYEPPTGVQIRISEEL